MGTKLPSGDRAEPGLGLDVTLAGGTADPAQAVLDVGRAGGALEVELAELELIGGVAERRGLDEPVEPPRRVPLDAEAAKIKDREVGHALGVARLGRRAEPSRRLLEVPGLGEEHREMDLRRHMTALGGAAEPVDGGLLVALDAAAGEVLLGELRLGLGVALFGEPREFRRRRRMIAGAHM